MKDCPDCKPTPHRTGEELANLISSGKAEEELLSYLCPKHREEAEDRIDETIEELGLHRDSEES